MQLKEFTNIPGFSGKLDSLVFWLNIPIFFLKQVRNNWDELLRELSETIKE